MKKQRGTPCILWVLLSVLVVASCKPGSKTKVSDEQVGSSSSSSSSSSGAANSSSSSSSSTTSSSSSSSTSSGLPMEQMRLNSTFPGDGEIRIALVSSIDVGFDQDVMVESATEIIHVSMGGEKVDGVIDRVNARDYRFTPAQLLSPDTQFSVTVSDQLMSTDGLLFQGAQWTFRTVNDVYTTSQEVIDLCMNDADIEMLALVNQARLQSRYCEDERGAEDPDRTYHPAAKRLSWNCLLQESSIIHSQDMQENNFFEHEGSDGSTVGDRTTRVGYDWQWIGENLAAGYPTISAAVNGLLGSRGHCQNMMNPHYTEFGAGFIQGDSGNTYQNYWTQNYGLPFN